MRNAKPAKMRPKVGAESVPAITELFAAIKNGDNFVGRLANIKAIQPNINLNEIIRLNNMGNGFTLLMFAALYNNEEAVDALIAEGADARIANAHGITALHFAAKNNNHHTAKALLDAGADVNAKTASGDTAIDLAVRSNIKKNNPGPYSCENYDQHPTYYNQSHPSNDPTVSKSRYIEDPAYTLQYWSFMQLLLNARDKSRSQHPQAQVRGAAHEAILAPSPTPGLGAANN